MCIVRLLSPYRKFKSVREHNASLKKLHNVLLNYIILEMYEHIVALYSAILASFCRFQPFFDSLTLHDTCGVNNLHGVPGLIAGIGGIIVAATATEDKYGARY